MHYWHETAIKYNFETSFQMLQSIFLNMLSLQLADTLVLNILQCLLQSIIQRRVSNSHIHNYHYFYCIINKRP